MSIPYHMKLFYVNCYPDIPEPHPISKINDPGYKFNNYIALYAICLWIVWIRVFDSYFDAYVKL